MHYYPFVRGTHLGLAVYPKMVDSAESLFMSWFNFIPIMDK